MTSTTYYNLNIVEGTDIVNPLTVDNPNYETIDEVMHDNAVAGVTLATEIANATVHAITRENSECAVIRFIATSEWKAGDTATVDGVPVTALLPSGETLPDGAYVINANVLCILTGTSLTVYAERKKVDNASEIAYNDTTVEVELNRVNTNLSNKVEEVSDIELTLSSLNGTIRQYYASKIGNIIFIHVTINVTSNIAKNAQILAGIPTSADRYSGISQIISLGDAKVYTSYIDGGMLINANDILVPSSYTITLMYRV